MNKGLWGGKVGLVNEYKPGYAKVYFEDDDIVTDWWQIRYNTSAKDKESYPLAVNEQVICLCDDHLEDGVILGALPNETDTPDSGAGAGKFRKVFEDGTVLEYNKTTHELTADVKGKVTVTADNDISATSSTNVKAKATIKATIEAPAIELKGNVTVLGTLAAGAISAAPIPGTTGATGKITADADIETTGKVTAANVEVSGDVKAGTVQLKTHVHAGVTTGPGSTAAPTP
jgi:phage baseplate assembly protein V